MFTFRARDRNKDIQAAFRTSEQFLNTCFETQPKRQRLQEEQNKRVKEQRSQAKIVLDPNYAHLQPPKPVYSSRAQEKTFFKGAAAFAQGMEPTFKTPIEKVSNKQLSR
jgi:hypothetical protein